MRTDCFKTSAFGNTEHVNGLNEVNNLPHKTSNELFLLKPNYNITQ